MTSINRGLSSTRIRTDEIAELQELIAATKSGKGVTKGAVDPATQAGARMRANAVDPALKAKLGAVPEALDVTPAQARLLVQLATRDVTDEEARGAGLLNARSAMTEKHVLKALEELGFEVGKTLDDPKSQKALEQLQKAKGLPESGELDLETLLAIVEAMMAKNAQNRPRPRPAPRPSSSTGGGTSSGGAPGSATSGASSAAGVSNGTTTPMRPSAPIDAKNWKPGKGDVTPEQLRQIVPGVDENLANNPNFASVPANERMNALAANMNRAMAEAGIDSADKKAAFVAQLAHESGGFRYSEEIASGAAYEGRGDLGNTQPGDGERFKGRGFIQLTGRSNYDAAGKALGLDLINQPELAAQPENAARIAAWYWSSRNLNQFSSGGSVSQAQFDQITYRINGGYNGKSDRDAYFAKAQQALAGNDGIPATGTLSAGEGAAKSVDIARGHLGENVSSLKGQAGDDLEMDPSIPNNVNCANFVSAVLESNGMISAGMKSAGVDNLDANLKRAGWQKIPLDQAQPGDVIIYRWASGGQHVELATGKGNAIGARNINPDGSQQISEGTISGGASDERYVLRAPA